MGSRFQCGLFAGVSVYLYSRYVLEVVKKKPFTITKIIIVIKLHNTQSHIGNTITKYRSEKHVYTVRLCVCICVLTFVSCFSTVFDCDWMCFCVVFCRRSVVSITRRRPSLNSGLNKSLRPLPRVYAHTHTHSRLDIVMCAARLLYSCLIERCCCCWPWMAYCIYSKMQEAWFSCKIVYLHVFKMWMV